MERVSPSSVPTLWAPLLPKSKKRAHRRWVNHHYRIFIFTIFHHHQILPNSYPPHTHLANLPTHPKNCTANDVVSHTLRILSYILLSTIILHSKNHPCIIFTLCGPQSRASHVERAASTASTRASEDNIVRRLELRQTDGRTDR